MKILVDMNLSPGWVAVLAEAGHDAVHWSSVGDIEAPDETLVAWAGESGRIIITRDLDFSAILATTGSRVPSLIQVRAQEVMVDLLKEQMLSVLETFEEQLHEGCVITLEDARARLRILPING